MVAFHYPDASYDRRLRITAGRADTGDNNQGASIDLHGNSHATNAGRLDLVAGRGGNMTFWASPIGASALERMRITNQGRVGIGTQAPGNVLDVNGGAAFQGNHLYVRNQASPAGAQTWGVVVSSADGVFNLGQASDLPPSGGNLVSSSFRIEPGAASNTLVLDTNDSVGVGTNAPQSRLDVRGGVRLGNDVDVCNASKAGTMRYNGAVIQFCNGAAWRAVGENRFGGMFEVVQVPAGEQCSTANPLTGACSCPAGFSRWRAHLHAPGYPVFACYPN